MHLGHTDPEAEMSKLLIDRALNNAAEPQLSADLKHAYPLPGVGECTIFEQPHTSLRIHT